MPQPSTLAAVAASGANSEEALVADILSSFEAHGGSAENKLGKEFRAWLMKFALTLHENKIRSQAWNELKSKCDVLMLLKELYLFTYSGKTSANVLQDACRFLNEELDKLLPKYVKLHKKRSALTDDPHSPTSAEQWKKGVLQIHSDLGVSKFPKYYAEVFLPAIQGGKPPVLP